MAIIFPNGGKTTLNESTVVNSGDLFNSNLLRETATLDDLLIAVGEAVDFFDENYDKLAESDYNYEIVKSKNLSESYVFQAAQTLNEGIGEFFGKLKDWAIKIWNSISTFFSNVWLKITNKMEYRARLIKNKDFIASIAFAKSNKDKFEGKSVSMPTTEAMSSSSTMANTVMGFGSKESDEISDEIKEFIENSKEKEDVSGDDLYDKIGAAETFYAAGFKKEMANTDKIKNQIKKMIDQFIKDLKGKTGNTTALSKLGTGAKTDGTAADTNNIDTTKHKAATKTSYSNTIGGKAGFSIKTGEAEEAGAYADNNAKTHASDTLTIEKGKKVIPALAKVMHRHVSLVHEIAEAYWKVLAIADSLGKGSLRELKSMR